MSKDNPSSEALLKTPNYGPEFPELYASVHEVSTFIGEFVNWYNHLHQHCGIGFHTPAHVHCGRGTSVATERSATFAQANPKKSPKG